MKFWNGLSVALSILAVGLTTGCGQLELPATDVSTVLKPSQPRGSSGREVAPATEHSEEFADQHYAWLVANDTGTCTTGVAAFKTTVYPLLRERCAKCHDSEHGADDPVGPAFAVEDVQKSYSAVVAYQNFDDIPNSIFAKKGGNLHCLNSYGYDCKTNTDDIATVVRAWWESGEKDCPRRGKYFSAQMPIPANLPDRSQGFAKVRWDLTPAGSSFRKSFIELEMQQFALPSDENLGAYRFRKPRLLTPTKTIALKDLKILVNGGFNPLEDSYRPISQTIAPGPVPADAGSPSAFAVLSTKAQIVLARTAADQIMLSLEELSSIANGIQCKALPKFESDVMPWLEFRNCAQCHSGGSNSQPGNSPAKDILSMGQSSAELCKSLLQRIDSSSMKKSPIVTYPALAVNGHPLVVTNSDEVMRAVGNWFAAELAQ